MYTYTYIHVHVLVLGGINISLPVCNITTSKQYCIVKTGGEKVWRIATHSPKFFLPIFRSCSLCHEHTVQLN